MVIEIMENMVLDETKLKRLKGAAVIFLFILLMVLVVSFPMDTSSTTVNQETTLFAR